MWLERSALEKTQIGVHFCIDSHLSLDGRAKLTDLRNRAVDIVRNDADTLRQQVVKSANVELLVFVRCVEHAGDLYAVPHDLTSSSSVCSDRKVSMSRHENSVSARVGSEAAMWRRSSVFQQ